MIKNKYIQPQGENLIISHPKIPQYRMIKVKGGDGIIEKLNKKTKLADFYMAEFQVTQELYQAVVNASSTFKGKERASRFQGKRRPVENINWYESVEFCQELNKLLELPQPIKGSDDKAELDMIKPGFRLPTEAEWEYAARGGDNVRQTVETRRGVSLQKNGVSQKYAGSNILIEVGWYGDNNLMETRAVGLKLPNPLGLYDMSGNVFEWCWDWYDNDKDSRVLRGGSWYLSAVISRVAIRYVIAPGNRDYLIGLRLVFCL